LKPLYKQISVFGRELKVKLTIIKPNQP